MAAPLRSMGIALLNASSGSAYADLWPVVGLEETLDRRRAA
jgi:hypothetical protein